MNYRKIFAALTAAGILAACTPAYADSDIEKWICIADDITKETAMKMYFPGTKLAVLYLAGNRNNVIDIKVLEKP